MNYFPSTTFPAANHCASLEAYAERSLLSFGDLADAHRRLTTAGIPVHWLQWMLGKPLSCFDWLDWAIFVGIARRLDEGRLIPVQVRQYVTELTTWAALYHRLEQVCFTAEPWIADIHALINLASGVLATPPQTLSPAPAEQSLMH